MTKYELDFLCFLIYQAHFCCWFIIVWTKNVPNRTTTLLSKNKGEDCFVIVASGEVDGAVVLAHHLTRETEAYA